jgi:hypothetical protein
MGAMAFQHRHQGPDSALGWCYEFFFSSIFFFIVLVIACTNERSSRKWVIGEDLHIRGGKYTSLVMISSLTLAWFRITSGERLFLLSIHIDDYHCS